MATFGDSLRCWLLARMGSTVLLPFGLPRSVAQVGVILGVSGHEPEDLATTGVQEEAMTNLDSDGES